MAGPEPDNPTMESGVDALIARLRDEGVATGRAEAERLETEARAAARAITEKARQEADAALEQARTEAEAFRRAGEEALQTAMRDTVLEMRSELMDRFSDDVKRLVSHELQSPDVLKQMVLAVAGRAGAEAAIPDDASLEVILPAAVVGIEALRSDPDRLREGPLTEAVLGLTAEMLRDGVTFSATDDTTSGIRIASEDSGMTLDLTDAAVAALLLQHMQPRFRAILEGVIK